MQRSNGERQGSHSLTKCLTLMKSMSNKGVATLHQKSQSGNFHGDPNEMV